MPAPSIDLDRLLKLRLVVARFGEMDLATWWNTKGQLGRLGSNGSSLWARRDVGEENFAGRDDYWHGRSARDACMPKQLRGSGFALLAALPTAPPHTTLPTRLR